jgi:hypothetical protein
MGNACKIPVIGKRFSAACYLVLMKISAYGGEMWGERIDPYIIPAKFYNGNIFNQCI